MQMFNLNGLRLSRHSAKRRCDDDDDDDVWYRLKTSASARHIYDKRGVQLKLCARPRLLLRATSP